MTKKNELNNLTKILLTIPSVLSFLYMFTFWFPTKFVWLIPSIKVYYIQMLALQILTVGQLIFLIVRLWSFKNIKKSVKSNWTWYLILFNFITCPIYIWKNDSELIQAERKSTMGNNV
jgi:hypothetical protein